MDQNEQLKRLARAVERFKAGIQALPEELFLKRMDGWSPRDIVAHFIGWNSYTIEGCREILNGQTPFYFDDAGNDYSNVNAESVKRFSSTNRSHLLKELDRSFQQLKTYLLSLEPSRWEANHGVRHGRWTITVRNTIDALNDDYDNHRQEIERWVSNVMERCCHCS